MLRPTRRSTTIALVLAGVGGLVGYLSVGAVELVQCVLEQEAQPIAAILKSRQKTVPGLRPVAYKTELPKIRSMTEAEMNNALRGPGEEPECETSDAMEDPLLMDVPGARKNPFEFGIDVAVEKAKVGAESIENIKLYGFIGSEPPKAIINAGGQTKILSAGERWGVIELLEVTPPMVRIRLDGVTRTWSILGKIETDK